MKKLIFALFLIAPFCTAYGADGGIIGSSINEIKNTKENKPSNNQNSNSEPQSSITDLSELENRTNQPMVIRTLNATQQTFDVSKPDANTLIVPYQKMATYKLRVREFMGTMIILPHGDGIKSFKLGDDVNFAFNPDSTTESNPRIGSADVKLPGSDTALNIVGISGNVYTFYLRGDTWDSTFDPTLKIYITDDDLRSKMKAIEMREKAREEALKSEKIKESITPSDEKEVQEDYLTEVEFNPESLDFEYKIVGGDESIRPYAVYSDGVFTYFRFGEHDSSAAVNELPAVYRVADGSDIPTNSTMKKGTLRVEGVHNKWTLRLGEKYLCIEKSVPLSEGKSRLNTFIKEG